MSRDATVGRLGQVCQRWIYTACLCFALDRDEQARSESGYGLAVYQLEYSRNLIFANGATMQQVVDTVVDRARSRLDVSNIRTIFGAKARPHRDRKHSSVIEAAIETPMYDQMYTPQPDGSLLIGDIHYRDVSAPTFQSEEGFAVLVEEARKLFGVNEIEVSERWQGIYTSAPGQKFLIEEPIERTRVVAVANGIGMTTCMGLALDSVHNAFTRYCASPAFPETSEPGLIL